MRDVGGLRTFFTLCYGTQVPGYVSMWVLSPDDRKDHKERFFKWPSELPEMVEFIELHKASHNVYFCPQLFESRRRKKDNVLACPNIWADLDTCPPDKLMVKPSITIESSPDRYQALWCLETPMAPAEAENISMRIAYAHAADGADRSGWDLTQLLRVPTTFNYKYGDDAPKVKIIDAQAAKYRLSDFMEYPEVRNSKDLVLPLPTEVMNEDPAEILQRYRERLNPIAFGLFSTEPANGTWSQALWRLCMICFESGMTREEVFHVTSDAACNKYQRDNKPPMYLWRDVCRAYLRCKENTDLVVTSTDVKPLLADHEQETREQGFVERYIDWASKLGDAAPQYHQAGAFTILSSVLSANIRIPTSFGTILPNLWFMILADTTLTRKSTAMDLATELLFSISEDYLLATDGSIEGLLTGLSMRPGQPSLFVRDEFSGLLEAMSKKDYMAGMGETLTKLYDGKPMKRILRKEIVSVQKPVLNILAGGIKNKIQSLLSFEDVSSGFIPRFLFITAESQVSKVRPLGPPTVRDLGERENILTEIRDIIEHYNQMVLTPVKATGIAMPMPKQFDVSLTGDAWARYNKLENELLVAGTSATRPELMTPLYARLAISTLKAASLIAASRQREDAVTIEEVDMVNAIKYATSWRDYANEVVNGIGKNALERDLERLLLAIVKNPGVSRSTLMRNYHLTARTADALFSTLEQRNLIVSTRMGQAQVFTAVIGAI